MARELTTDRMRAGKRRQGLTLRLCIAVGVMICAAGFFWWLWQIPPGVTSRPAGTYVQVHIIPSVPAPSAASQEATGAHSIASDAPQPPQPVLHAGKAPALAREKTASVRRLAPDVTAIARSDMDAPPKFSTTSLADSPEAAAFRKQLLAYIERYRRYPDAARPARLQGVAELLFTIDRKGAVLDVKIQKSSGSVILDDEAIQTIERAQPLLTIPPALPGRLNIVLPVSFFPP